MNFEACSLSQFRYAPIKKPIRKCGGDPWLHVNVNCQGTYMLMLHVNVNVNCQGTYMYIKEK